MDFLLKICPNCKQPFFFHYQKARNDEREIWVCALLNLLLGDICTLNIRQVVRIVLFISSNLFKLSGRELPAIYIHTFPHYRYSSID